MEIKLTFDWRKTDMKNKWNNIGELIKNIKEDDLLFTCRGHIKRVTYAPHIGYGAWIFKYKDTPVCLWDMGNGHYSFYSAVSHIDILIAQLCCKFKWFRKRYER